MHMLLDAIEAGPACIHCRPALVDSIELPGPYTKQLSAVWQAEHGWTLPDFPYVMQLRLSDDPDAEAVAVPSCCILSAAGIVQLPLSMCSEYSSIDQLAGAAPSILWAHVSFRGSLVVDHHHHAWSGEISYVIRLFLPVASIHTQSDFAH